METIEKQLRKAKEDAEAANSALRKERDLAQRYLRLVEAIIVTLDSDGTITMLNRKGCELLGYKEEEILGKNWFHTCLSQPEGRETVYPVFKDIMTGNLSTAEYYENEILTKDGQKRLIAWHNNYFRDDNGHIVGTISAGEDITERKSAEDFLKESEALYRSLFENNCSVMLLIDPDTAAIIDANPSACAYYGHSKETLKKMKITEINMLSQKEVFEEMGRAKSENRNYFNFCHRLSNGNIRDVEVYSGPITVSGKSLLCSIIHDITERKSAESERERLINELQKTLLEVKALQGLLPICSNCKKIRDDRGYWNQIERYIERHSHALFSHGLCPECADKLYGDEDWYKKRKE